jgi:hypothetical protein
MPRHYKGVPLGELPWPIILGIALLVLSALIRWLLGL